MKPSKILYYIASVIARLTPNVRIDTKRLPWHTKTLERLNLIGVNGVSTLRDIQGFPWDLLVSSKFWEKKHGVETVKYCHAKNDMRGTMSKAFYWLLSMNRPYILQQLQSINIPLLHNKHYTSAFLLAQCMQGLQSDKINIFFDFNEYGFFWDAYISLLRSWEIEAKDFLLKIKTKPSGFVRNFNVDEKIKVGRKRTTDPIVFFDEVITAIKVFLIREFKKDIRETIVPSQGKSSMINDRIANLSNTNLGYIKELNRLLPQCKSIRTRLILLDAITIIQNLYSEKDRIDSLAVEKNMLMLYEKYRSGITVEEIDKILQTKYKHISKQTSTETKIVKFYHWWITYKHLLPGQYQFESPRGFLQSILVEHNEARKHFYKELERLDEAMGSEN